MARAASSSALVKPSSGLTMLVFTMLQWISPDVAKRSGDSPTISMA